MKPQLMSALTRPLSRRTSTGEPLGELADLSALFGLANLRVSYEVLQPGRRSAPPHRHTQTEEFVVVLEGTVEAQLGDEVHRLTPGMALGFPPDATSHHEVRNPGAAPARILSIAWAGSEDRVEFKPGS
jgi:uncharacterized cupin superfamily protein